MSKEFVLQACPKSLNAPRDLDGTSCVQDLARGWYKDTEYSTTGTKNSKLLLERARNGELVGYPLGKYKFKLRKEVAA